MFQPSTPVLITSTTDVDFIVSDQNINISFIHQFLSVNVKVKVQFNNVNVFQYLVSSFKFSFQNLRCYDANISPLLMTDGMVRLFEIVIKGLCVVHQWISDWSQDSGLIPGDHCVTSVQWRTIFMSDAE